MVMNYMIAVLDSSDVSCHQKYLHDLIPPRAQDQHKLSGGLSGGESFQWAKLD